MSSQDSSEERDVSGRGREKVYGPRGHHWVFTINNPSHIVGVPDPVLACDDPGSWWFRSVKKSDGKVECQQRIRYLCFQVEIGAEGTVHYQGYIQLFDCHRMSTMKSMFHPTCHWEVARGSATQCRKYCSKKDDTTVEDTFEEFGTICLSMGERIDLEAVNEAINDGASIDDIRNRFPSNYYRYCKSIEGAIRRVSGDAMQKSFKEEFDVKENDLSDWQKDALRMLKVQDNRHVLWIYDDGDTGKTQFSKFLMVNYGAYYCSNEKKTDLAYEYNCEPYVVMDVPKDYEAYVPYNVLEHLKNGILKSTKYVVVTKLFKPPKILVVCNFKPDVKKMGSNRFNIYKVVGGMLVLQQEVDFGEAFNYSQ